MTEFNPRPILSDADRTVAGLRGADQSPARHDEAEATHRGEAEEIDMERREYLGPETAVIDPANPGSRSAMANRTGPAQDDSEDEPESLFSPDESRSLQSQWQAIQVGFVDEPRIAVQQADGLVADAIERLSVIFAQERDRLDQQWNRGSSVSTEDLRLALRRYHAFFGRLLSV